MISTLGEGGEATPKADVVLKKGYMIRYTFKKMSEAAPKSLT